MDKARFLCLRRRRNVTSLVTYHEDSIGGVLTGAQIAERAVRLAALLWRLSTRHSRDQRACMRPHRHDSCSCSNARCVRARPSSCATTQPPAVDGAGCKWWYAQTACAACSPRAAVDGDADGLLIVLRATRGAPRSRPRPRPRTRLVAKTSDGRDECCDLSTRLWSTCWLSIMSARWLVLVS